MRRVFLGAMASFLVLGIGMAGSEAQATIMFSLSSSENLAALPVGEDVWFEVQVSGLPEGQKLSYLSAIVSYSGTSVDNFTITPGGILPNPSHFTVPSEATSTETDATYDAIDSPNPSDDHVASNGVFYQFKTKVQTPGSGMFQITDAYAAEGLDFLTTEISPASGSLSFQAVNTPEPATWAMLLVMAAILGSYCFVKRRR